MINYLFITTTLCIVIQNASQDFCQFICIQMNVLPWLQHAGRTEPGSGCDIAGLREDSRCSRLLHPGDLLHDLAVL